MIRAIYVFYLARVLEAEYDEDAIDWGEIDTRLYETTKLARKRFPERKPILELDSLSGDLADIFFNFMVNWDEDESEIKQFYEREIPTLLLDNAQIEVIDIDYVGSF